MRVILAAVVMAFAMAASAQAYQNQENGSGYACNQRYSNAMQNLASYAPSPSTQNPQCELWNVIRHGNDDVTYDLWWKLTTPAWTRCCAASGALQHLSDRFQVRVLGPNTAMHESSVADLGVAYRGDY